MNPEYHHRSLLTSVRAEGAGSWGGMGQPRESGDRIPLERTIRLHDRPLRLRFSPPAARAAAALTEPLTIEMELYFSCFVRKAVRFRTGEDVAAVPAAARTALSDRLQLQFRPVTTQQCRMTGSAAEPPLEAMPVARPQAFVPRWIDIDFKHGTWFGEYGY